MELRHRVEYLRQEHAELLSLAARIERLLESASKNNFSEHLKSLTELRSLEHGLAGIVEHCHAENRIIESTYRRYLQPDERARIDTEHEQIIRFVTSFREELRYATVDRTMAMILPGMDVVKWLRAHIAYERELLDRIVGLERSKRSPGIKKTAKKGHEQKGKDTAKRRTHTKVAHALPYTLESHPEL